MELSHKTRMKYNHLISNMKDLGDFSNRELIMSFLDSQTFHMKRNYLLALIDYLKKDGGNDYKYYRNIARNVCMEDTLKRVKRAPTEDEKSNYISWKQILDIRSVREELKTRSNSDHMLYIITCLYTYIPPQRGQVYYNCYIDRDVEGSNLIDLNKKELVVREHKTMKAYGNIIIELPDELVRILEEYKPLSNKNNYRLLSTTTGRPVSEVSFNKLMTNIFGKGISTNMMRKIYVTDKLENEELSIAERKELAHIMGHNISTQEFMYNKVGISQSHSSSSSF